MARMFRWCRTSERSPEPRVTDTRITVANPNMRHSMDRPMRSTSTTSAKVSATMERSAASAARGRWSTGSSASTGPTATSTRSGAGATDTDPDYSLQRPLHPRLLERRVDQPAGDETDAGEDQYRARGGGPVTVVDINREMLAVGRDSTIDHGIVDIGWLCGDAEALPIADASVDAYTIAFAIRNVTSIPAALAEARRVLKPGGRFLCLERLYDMYSFNVLPALGAVVARDADAYRYLAESIRRFPPQATFAGMIAEAGLDLVKFRNLSGGIAALHSAWRT